MLSDKIQYSIDLLKRAEPMALKMSDKGFFLAFSGGKDSQCLYHIAKMAECGNKADTTDQKDILPTSTSSTTLLRSAGEC